MKFLRRFALALTAWLLAIAVWIAIGPAEAPDQSADVAIVLGAAAYDGQPSPVFRERINHALSLKRQGRVARLLFTGGSADEGELSEAETARNYAIESGIAPEVILIETSSRTTHQNLIEARAVMRENAATSAIIISDPLHLQRAMQMAASLDMTAYPSATPTSLYQSWRTQLPFLLRETYFMHHFWLLGE